MSLQLTRCPVCDTDNFVVDIAPKGLVILKHDRETEDGYRMCRGTDRSVDPADMRPYTSGEFRD